MILVPHKTEPSTTDVFHAGPFKTLVDVEYATAAWVDRLNRRLHSSIGQTLCVRLG